MPRFIPLHDNVLVQRTRDPDKVGSIHVPENARRKGSEAVVLAVGPGRLTKDGRRIESQVKVGDRVVLSTSGLRLEVELEGRKVALVREHEIDAVAEP